MSYRIAKGLKIATGKIVKFRFDAQSYEGLEGDSIASALLACGVRLFGRSFKYHRPRGVLSAGAEEPNALVTVTINGRREPNARATEVVLQEGMEVESQNNWPSLRFDVGALNQLLGPILSAGFYYKTFMWPGIKGWMYYERFIRNAAGLGRVGTQEDDGQYDSISLHCDHLVVGGGFAGLLAVRAYAAAGKKVIWAEQSTILPELMMQNATIDGQPASEWCRAEVQALRAAEHVDILEETSAFGVYDQNLVAAVQRPREGKTFERFIEIEPREIIVATGAIERSIVFAGNDVPGVMLANAAQTYLDCYGVAVGKAIVGFTNNDTAYDVCFTLAEAGIDIVAIADTRSNIPPETTARAEALGIKVFAGHVVSKANGNRFLKSVQLESLQGGIDQNIACDTLLMSGGWNPAVHLWSQAGGLLEFDQTTQAMIPKGQHLGVKIVGAAAGKFDVEACCEQLREILPDADIPKLRSPRRAGPVDPFFEVSGKGKKFVDFQNDVTASDVRQAMDEGYQSVEHLKRYTTLGMGTDQGKTSNVSALMIMADSLGKLPGEVGTTKFRPPYKPVTVAAFAGMETGSDSFPTRRTSIHDWHANNDGVFLESGDWLRTAAYPKADETLREAAIREAAHVRSTAGIVDVSTLGKILVEGPDALTFLNCIYVNAFTSLKIDRSRYGIMLREDGLVLDDGTVCRLGKNRYLVTTTTAQAGTAFRNFDRYLQVDWPELRVATTSLTDHFAAIALAGPNSRHILQDLLSDRVNVDSDALPFMAHCCCEWRGRQLEIFRVSFSGELAYELFIPSSLGMALWEALLAVGGKNNLRPYGLKAMDVLRVEKGHLTGAEIDGRRTLGDIGFGKMAKPERHYIGKVLATREAFQKPNRLQLVGLKSRLPNERIEEGMHLLPISYQSGAAKSQGHVTSACYSPAIENEIGLAVLESGSLRHGETIVAVSPMKDLRVEVEVTGPLFFDPKGERLHG